MKIQIFEGILHLKMFCCLLYKSSACASPKQTGVAASCQTDHNSLKWINKNLEFF